MRHRYVISAATACVAIIAMFSLGTSTGASAPLAHHEVPKPHIVAHRTIVTAPRLPVVVRHVEHVATTTSTTVPSASATTVPPKTNVSLIAYPPSPYVMAEWAKVNVCEEGGNWSVRGSLYSGGLGISNTNWQIYSAGLGFPSSAADATPAQQVYVAERIQGFSGYVPDQYGCSGAW
jgi:Transglycosylase-like domain